MPGRSAVKGQPLTGVHAEARREYKYGRARDQERAGMRGSYEISCDTGGRHGG